MPWIPAVATFGQGVHFDFGLGDAHSLFREPSVNPRPAGVFSRTRPAGGGADSAPLSNSRTNRRSEADEAAIESPEGEDSNAH